MTEAAATQPEIVERQDGDALDVTHVKFTDSQQMLAAIDRALEQASRETGVPMRAVGVRQSHTPPAGPGEHDVYDLWVTCAPAPANSGFRQEVIDPTAGIA